MHVLIGLIGRRLSHSLSQEYFRDKFRQQKLIDIDYELFEIDSIELLPSLLRSKPQLAGFNVTIPYKEQVIKYLDKVDAFARDIGAVNTVLRCDDLLIGYNTDAFGFEVTLKPLMHAEHKSSKALVLGTGGAAKAVVHVLRKEGIDYTMITSRKIPGLLSYEELTESIIEQHLLIINTTPLGMYPNNASFPDIPYNAINSQHVLIDLVYNPLETQFLKFGNEKGAKCVNGITMLYAQADAAWQIWKPELMKKLNAG